MRNFTPFEINELIRKNLDPFKLRKTTGPDIPIQYITNSTIFCGFDFFVDKRVLIPRPETEELVRLAIANAPQLEKDVIKIIDIGTGSGCIGISVAKELSSKYNINLTLSDISEPALDVAKINTENLINQNNISITLKKSFLLNEFINDKFDIILANLPYIPTSRINKLDKNVKDFEPYLALDGGEEGLDLINSLINQLPNNLNLNGFAIFEVDDTHSQIPRIETLNVDILKDSSDKTRFWFIKSKS